MKDPLDLQGAIRPGLDILAHEIVIALKKRSRFPRNPEIYGPGLVVGRPDLSLLEYELHRTEQLHAELGRYRYATQDAFTDVGDVELVIERPEPELPVRNYRCGMGTRVRGFYQEALDVLCAPGSDSDTYGETVTADVNVLLNVYERVNLGKSVAESKFSAEPEAYRATGGDAEALRGLIVVPEREAQVLEIAEGLARHYEFPPEHARRVFEGMIALTVDLEIVYLQRRIEDDEV